MSETVAALHVDAEGAKAHPPIVTLQIIQWKDAPADGVKGVQAKFVECDYPGGTAADADPTQQTPLGVIEFDLVPNDATSDAGAPAPPEWKITKPKLVQVPDGKGGLTAANKKNTPTAAHADLVVFLGVRQETQKKGKGKDATTETLEVPILIPLKVPREADGFHDEGDDYEIGVVLSTKGGTPFNFLKRGQTAGSTVPRVAPVRKMLGLRVTAQGARTQDGKGSTALDTWSKQSGEIGRFSDPMRNPSVGPDEAMWFLDARIILELNKKAAPVDVDGLLFKNFVPSSKTRAQVVDELHADFVKNKVAAPTKDDALGKSDVEKAFFIFHDIGAGLFGPYATDRYQSEKTPIADSVNGYMNLDGTVATHFDLDDWWKGGTVYEWTATGKWMRGYCIGYETVSEVERDNANTYYPLRNKANLHDYYHGNAKSRAAAKAKWEAGPTKPYACMAKGYVIEKKKRVDAWFKWTDDLIDSFASLYVIASARANHLLTITTHLETDRNLMFSLVHWTHTRDEMDKAWAKAGSRMRALLNDSDAGSVHNDPSGCDLQLLYDKISEKLNALGGLQIPKGSRYGPHRERALNLAKGDDAGNPGIADNGDDQLHVFPQQSNPHVVRGGWANKKDWKAAKPAKS